MIVTPCRSSAGPSRQAPVCTLHEMAYLTTTSEFVQLNIKDSSKDIDLVAVLAGEIVSDGHSVLVFCKSKQASLDGHICILNRCSVWHPASTNTTLMSLMGQSTSGCLVLIMEQRMLCAL